MTTVILNVLLGVSLVALGASLMGIYMDKRCDRQIEAELDKSESYWRDMMTRQMDLTTAFKGQAYEWGFKDGIAHQDKEDALEEYQDELEEQRKSIAEELEKWKEDPTSTLKFYPFANRNFG